MLPIKLYLDQQHPTSSGSLVRSHLLAVPKGYALWPFQADSLLRAFGRRPRGEDRTTMAPMDKWVMDMDGYDVYWLCDSQYAHQDDVVRTVRSILKSGLVQATPFAPDDDNAVIIG